MTKLPAISFPSLFCSKGVLLRQTEKEFHKFSYRGATGNGSHLFTFTPGPEGSSPPLWILDASGQFHEIRLKTVRRPWGQSLRWLWDFTLAECEVLPPRQLTAGEWLEKLKGMKGRPPFATAGHLRGFMERMPQDRVFGEAEFREFWDKFGYEIKEAAC
jgi:hypothetical protein